MTLSGLVPVLATPFTPDGGLDLPGLRRLTEFQLAAGADGVALFGMASEGFALTAADRERILAAVRETVAGAVPVVAGIAATSTVTALEQARAAADGGADALMVLPPFMVKPSAAQLIDFYGTVAGAGCEVMVQDAPGATGVTMPEGLIVELSKLEGVTSVKVEAPPTAPKTGAVVRGVDPAFAVFGGQNALFCLEEYAAGATGTMPACEFTDLLAPVLAGWAAGRRAEAHAAFGRLLPLIRFGMQPGLAWAVHKEVLVRRGLIASAAVRSPARDLDAATLAGLDEVLAALGLPAAP
ncbi:dihydrodipicolinate synthase family protein [Actinomadura viridis]|uniref:4-hydroxy-tetrahydrodipicolinate synthase n=1 Tax=Actinomadura viridis TaxID=58110 RepID=A0A931DW82_9ACTN|nr:dihydrodipicolinate synthase family protein [Actinomadura viridis]MBG6093863.1 4-hydroxy-tetrahydrodipicolinate synthase [Actinomadura viridis]